MNTQLEDIFNQAKESEPELKPNQFMSGLQAELKVQQLYTESKFDWLLIVAAVLASLAVFFLTPAYSWLVSLPNYLVAANYVLSLPLVLAWVSVLTLITFFSYSDWELH